MQKGIVYFINGITWYRLLAAFVLAYLLLQNNLAIFKWLLLLSFLTDAIDGYLARKFNTQNIRGAKLDSVADMFTIIVAVAGLFVFRADFLKENMIVIGVLMALYLGQIILALYRYHRISSFHTYLAKFTSILGSTFLVLTYFFNEPLYTLFYLTALFTTLELLEEIILVLILPEWKTNVKGLFWILHKRKF